MTTLVQNVLSDFNQLSDTEKQEVAVEIARRSLHVEYGPLSDEALTEIAAQQFAELDEEESAQDQLGRNRRRDVESIPMNQIDDAAFLKSRFIEQLVEHAFIAEVLQEAWFHFGLTVEVLRSEVDSAGYDLVLECNGELRYVQLKSMKIGGRRVEVNINRALANKAGWCVIWVIWNPLSEIGRVEFEYRFFGATLGQPPPSLDCFPNGRHSKGTATGQKNERPTICRVKKSRFEPIPTIRELVKRLFGLHEPRASSLVKGMRGEL